MALWIVLGAAGAVLLLLLGASLYFYNFAFLRRGSERGDREFEEEASIWHSFSPRMEEAQAYIKAHTGERPQITSFDGLRLSALYLPAPGGSPKGTVLAFHGYRSLATIDFALEVEFFHRLGYDVLLPYQRSHGPSQGRHITFGVKERYDCRDWAWYAARRFGEDRPLYLAGISMGCATVLMSLSLNLPPNVQGVLADCGFTSPWEIIRHVAKADFHLPAFPLLWLLDLWCRALAGFALKEADTRKALGSSSLPVLFLHGKEDKFVPVSMTEENYRACRGEKDLYLVPGAAHAQSYGTDTPGCQARIEKLLRR